MIWLILFRNIVLFCKMRKFSIFYFSSSILVAKFASEAKSLIYEAHFLLLQRCPWKALREILEKIPAIYVNVSFYDFDKKIPSSFILSWTLFRLFTLYNQILTKKLQNKTVTYLISHIYLLDFTIKNPKSRNNQRISSDTGFWQDSCSFNDFDFVINKQ